MGLGEVCWGWGWGCSVGVEGLKGVGLVEGVVVSSNLLMKQKVLFQDKNICPSP